MEKGEDLLKQIDSRIDEILENRQRETEDMEVEQKKVKIPKPKKERRKKHPDIKDDTIMTNVRLPRQAHADLTYWGKIRKLSLRAVLSNAILDFLKSEKGK